MSREPRALLFILGLAIAGHAARAFIGRSSAPPGEVFAQPRAGDGNPSTHRARAQRTNAPLRSGELIDINSASAEEIARLPRVGMSLAKRIVADRGARGPFQGQADLDRVGGVGPGLLAALNERVKYGPGPPGLGGANRGISGAYGSTPGLPGPATVDLNLASEADLLALPGVGQARARAILAYRRDQGPFAALSDLGRVPGFSQSLVARLGPFVRVGR